MPTKDELLARNTLLHVYYRAGRITPSMLFAMLALFDHYSDSQDWF